MGKTKTKKFRGSMTHGRGKKAGRGSGLRGGRGNAGMNKHKFVARLFIERETNKPYWGRVGFKRHPIAGDTVVANVGRLEELFPGQTEIDLTSAGFEKLLGAGQVRSALTVTVASATDSAVAKIEEAGGKVVVTSSGTTTEE